MDARSRFEYTVGTAPEWQTMDERDKPPTLEELRARREEILSIAAARGASNVRVFGSVARDDAGPESDIDFLVDLERGRDLFELGGRISELEDLPGRPVDVVEIGKPSRVAGRIQRKAVQL